MSFQKHDPATHMARRNWRILGCLVIICWLIMACAGSMDTVQARYVIQERIMFSITIAGASG